MKGLIRGILAGSAAAVAGMVALSQLAPPPEAVAPPSAAPVVAAPPPKAEPAAETAAAPTTLSPADMAPADTAPADTAAAAQPAPVAAAAPLSPVPAASEAAQPPLPPPAEVAEPAAAPAPAPPPAPAADTPPAAPAGAQVAAGVPSGAVAEAPRPAPVDPSTPVRPVAAAAVAARVPSAPPAGGSGPAVATAPTPPAPAAADARPAPAAAVPAVPATPPDAPLQAIAARAAPGGPAGKAPRVIAETAPAVAAAPAVPALGWAAHHPDPLPPPPPAARLTPGDTFLSDAPLIVPAGADPTPPPAPGTTVRRGGDTDPATPIEAGLTDLAPAAPAAAPDPYAPPILREAGAFMPTGDRPPFAIILLDTAPAGTDPAGTDPAAIASLPFPVTVAIDPLSPGAADRAAIYRAAGKEVLMLLTALPEGATAADIEQNLAVMADTLPQATGAIDGPAARVQNDLQAAGQLVPVLAAQGRGLVTWDVGLDAAAQVARREGLPAATIFRHLDADGESRHVIRRYLDRAAFRAAQEGEVAVAGEIRPETIAALLEWAAEGRAATVDLAPASVLMTN
jgi:hypothetical protein